MGVKMIKIGNIIVTHKSTFERNEEAKKPYKVNFGFTRDTYSERLVENPFLFRNIIPPPAKVLDVGCWESINSISLAMLGYDVTGIDMMPYGYKHKNFTFIQDDFLKHDFGNERFDVVVDISAIEHFGLLSYATKERNDNAHIEAMNKIKRLLKPQGQLIFTAPYGVHNEVPNFERIFDDNDLNKLLSGFSIKEEKTFLVNRKEGVIEIPKAQAVKIPHDEDKGIYSIICINAFKV